MSKQVFKPRDYAYLPDPVSGYVVVQVGDKGFTAGEAGASVTPVSKHKMAAIILTKEQSASLEMCTDQESVVKTVEDMVKLGDLREATLLHNLRERFFEDSIYTKIGTILVSVNPFKLISGLYGADTLEAYAQAAERKDQDGGSVLPPHVFQIADHAYRNMVSERESQACLVSGESGAGKTEATKVLLQFLTEMSAKTATEDWGEQGRLQEQILKANPLMEAFGNAKTVRNNNSSRFGKFVDVKFNARLGTIIGGTITQYLLEKSRIVQQSNGERNYHIFYQLCAGCTSDPEIRKRYLIGNPDQYHYLNQNKQSVSFGINDDRGWEETIQAMQILGMSVQEKDAILRTVACCLHLGNINFAKKEISGNDGCEVENMQVLQLCAFQLGVSPEKLAAALTTKSILAREGVLYQYYNVSQASDIRDTIAKSIYGNLFEWLIKRINFALKTASKAAQLGQQLASGNAAATIIKDAEKVFADSRVSKRIPATDLKNLKGALAAAQVSGVFQANEENIQDLSDVNDDHFQKLLKGNDDALCAIGVLDIFGFESFLTNSFEQLCINYCNEKLQGYFTENIFKLEQAQYALEGIDVSVISFKDNSEVLELLEKKGDGVFSMIDEEISVPKGTDETLLSKSFKKFEKNSFFKKNAKKNLDFIIVHFAGEVSYTITGFLNKNKDLLPQDIGSLLVSSSSKFVQTLFSGNGLAPIAGKKTTEVRSTTTVAKKSLVAQFKDQLAALMVILKATQPHFIRCVKPNKELQGNLFDGPMVLEQLRYSGLLEVCKIRKQGYPVRKEHKYFIWRFSPLLGKGSGLSKADIRKICELLETRKFLNKNEWKLGKTKIFLKNEAYDRMERAREAALSSAAVIVQAAARGKVKRRAYQKMKLLLKEIDSATKKKDVVEIEALLLRAGELPNLGRHLKQVHAARKMIQQVLEERRVEGLLQDAINGGEVADLESAIFAAVEIGYQSPALATAKGVVQELKDERVLKERLQAALNNPSEVKEIRDTYALAKKNSKFCSREANRNNLERAEKILARVEAIEKHLAELKRAIDAKDLAGIKKTVEALDGMGLNSATNDLIKKGLEMAKLTEDDSSKFTKQREHLIAEAEKALTSKDLKTLQWVQFTALELGMMDGKNESVDKAMKLLQEIEKNAQLGASMGAGRKALAVKQARANGIDRGDLAELEKLITEAKGKGVPDDDMEMKRSVDAIKRAKRQIEIQEEMKEIIADTHARFKDYKVLKAALAKCEGIGMDTVESVVMIREKILQLEADGAGELEERPKVRASMTEDAIEKMNADRLQQASGPGYHFGNFYKLRSDADYAKGILFNKSKPIHLKLSHQSEPIHKSLLELNPDLSRQAVRLNRSILGYCGDVVMPFPSTLAQDVVDKVIVLPELADEVYVQLCKHLTGNADHQSIGRAWQLICIFAGAFPPSVKFELYFLNFLQRFKTSDGIIGTYANYAIRRLQTTILFGATEHGVSIDEIVAYGDRPPLLATILLTDSTPITELFPIPPHMNVDDVLRICTEFLALQDERRALFGIFVRETDSVQLPSKDAKETVGIFLPPPPAFEDFDFSDMPPPPPANDLPPPPPPELDDAEDLPPRTMYPLPSNSYLGDVVLDMARLHKEKTFVFKKKFFLPGKEKAGKDPIYNRLVYLQVLDEAFTGNWHVPSQETMLQLCTIAMVVDLGDDFPKNDKDLLKEGLKEYLPPFWRNKMPVPNWAPLVIKKSSEYLKIDPEELQLLFLMICADELPQYGSTVFFVRQQENGSDFLLCVMHSKCQVLNLIDRKVVATIDYAAVKEFTPTSKSLLFDTGNKKTNVTLFTSQGAEIASIINEYEEMLANQTGRKPRKTMAAVGLPPPPPVAKGIDLNQTVEKKNEDRKVNASNATQAAAQNLLGTKQKKQFNIDSI